MSNSKLTVLGIDPGIANTGWMLVGLAGSRYSRLSGGTVTTSSTDATGNRLLKIHDALVTALEGAGEVDAIAIENVYWGRNVSSCISTGQVVGTVALLAAARGIDILEFTPQQVKRATGLGGKATKSNVALAVSRLLSMGEVKMSAHESDAGAVALAGLLSLRSAGSER